MIKELIPFSISRDQAKAICNYQTIPGPIWGILEIKLQLEQYVNTSEGV